MNKIQPVRDLPKPPPYSSTPSRYQWGYNGVTFDFYRLCEILELKSQPQIHAIKKLIRAGRSIKSPTQDIDEAIDALNRWKEMIEEDDDDTEKERSRPVDVPFPKNVKGYQY